MSVIEGKGGDAAVNEALGVGGDPVAPRERDAMAHDDAWDGTRRSVRSIQRAGAAESVDLEADLAGEGISAIQLSEMVNP